MTLVNRYIGVAGGYLGDFSYASHADFYPEYCNLSIDPNQYDGTTRQRFIAILSSAEPRTQAAVLRGILERFPVGTGPPSRTEALAQRFREAADRLASTGAVRSMPLTITTDVVERAIADAESLIRDNGATSGVDRLHTALHGYLIEVCRRANLPISSDAKLPALLKVLRKQHPRLKGTGPRADDITKVLRSCGSILDTLLPVRNMSSMAHPSDQLLPPEEAMLVVNVARSLLHYLDSKLK